MEKDLEFIELFEVYKGLLTEKQRELFSSHYLFDLSLAEISEQEGGTRQSVYDQIKKVKAKLSEYERVLGLAGKYSEIKALAGQISDEEVADKIVEIIGR